jgi:hypothetical protein
VGENIVDLASDPVAFGQGGGTIPFGVGADPLGQELLGLEGPLGVLASAGAKAALARPLGRPAPTGIRGPCR